MNSKKIRELVGLASLLAIVIVLQLIGSFIKIGTFSISLVLIPIVIGAVLFGPKGGTILGVAFGIVVLIQCATGVDAGGAIMWGVNPWLTALLCMFKGGMAGFLSGIVFKLLKNKNKYLAIIIAAMVALVTNTTIFCIALYAFYYDTLQSWAGGENTLTYVITGLIGVNFLIEFLINAILSPAIIRIIEVGEGSFSKNEE